MTIVDGKVHPSLIRWSKVFVEVLSGSPWLHQQPDSVRSLRHASSLAVICQIAIVLLSWVYCLTKKLSYAADLLV
jgi:hypothetical protein